MQGGAMAKSEIRHDPNAPVCWCPRCLVKVHKLEPVIDGPERYWDPIQGDMRVYPWDPNILDSSNS